jgi:hypothetical protein
MLRVQDSLAKMKEKKNEKSSMRANIFIITNL